MADNLSVSTQFNSTGQPVEELANFSDKRNNNFTIIGIPGTTYSLPNMVNEVQGATIVAPEAQFDLAEQQLAFNFDTSMQSSLPSVTLLPDQVIMFTDTLGNTLSLLGSANTAYDLNLINYLYAIVNAMDLFMTMTYGDSYSDVKHQKLALLNLE